MTDSSQPTTSGNGIADRQDEEHNLRKLAAQRHLYSRAKAVLSIQFTAVLFFQLWFVLTLFETRLKSIGVGMAVVYAFVDLIWLVPQQKKFRSRAAKIQEDFDCEVLGLPWKTLKAGDRPRPEEIEDEYRRYLRKHSTLEALRGWYGDPRIAVLPLPLARLLCQRTNVVWDGKLRKHFANWMLGATIALVCLILLVGIIDDITLRDFVISAITPLLPTILFGARQFSDSRETAIRQEKLEQSASRLIEAAGRHVPVTPEEARDLQDEVLDIRSRNPLIFDWIYRRKRNEYAEVISAGTNELLRRLGKP